MTAAPSTQTKHRAMRPARRLHPPSTRTAGIAGLSLTLALAAAAGLDAPKVVWLVIGVAAVACFLAAVVLYLVSDREPRRSTGAVRVVTAPKDLRIPLHTAPQMEVSEQELQRIAADRDSRFAEYRRMPSKTPRGRLEAHAKRGTALVTRIDETTAKQTSSLSAGMGSAAEIETLSLVDEMRRWLATAHDLVKELAPSLLDEYETDRALAWSRGPSSVAEAMFRMWEPLRQRLDGLHRVIDAMSA